MINADAALEHRREDELNRIRDDAGCGDYRGMATNRGVNTCLFTSHLERTGEVIFLSGRTIYNCRLYCTPSRGGSRQELGAARKCCELLGDSSKSGKCHLRQSMDEFLSL